MAVLFGTGAVVSQSDWPYLTEVTCFVTKDSFMINESSWPPLYSWHVFNLEIGIMKDRENFSVVYIFYITVSLRQFKKLLLHSQTVIALFIESEK